MDEIPTRHPLSAAHSHTQLVELVNETRAAEGDAVRESMARLAEYLAGHFGAEEAPTGWMARAHQLAPERADVVEELQAEHGAILAAARGAAAGHGDAGSWAKLLDLIETHERREASILEAIDETAP